MVHLRSPAARSAAVRRGFVSFLPPPVAPPEDHRYGGDNATVKVELAKCVDFEMNGLAPCVKGVITPPATL